MQKILAPQLKNDLRKKNNISDIFFFNRISIQSCMVILFVFIVLLLSILSVTTSPNPGVIFRI
ncbi:MAG: DUF3270 family protein [Methanobacteriaceae archaeon]|jgi:hypothetical protein|nr:DUF3270 family protein [Candidatus Methanorudis spinitermitis]